MRFIPSGAEDVIFQDKYFITVITDVLHNFAQYMI